MRDRWKKPVRSVPIYSHKATAMNPIIKEITSAQVKKDTPAFRVGDGVKVHTKVREGDKERIQVFAGIVIALKGHGIHESFTVRRISYGEGVERVFPLHSPFIEKIVVETPGRARRAKLYHLRGIKGALTVKAEDSADTKAASKAKKTAAAAE